MIRSIALDVAGKRFSTTSIIALTFSCDFEINLRAKEDQLSVVNGLNRFHRISRKFLLSHEGWNVLFQIFFIAAQFEDR